MLLELRTKNVNAFLDDYEEIYKVFDNSNYKRNENLILEFISSNIDDIVFAIEVRKPNTLKSREIPMFSNFDDCTIGMCEILDSIGNDGIDMVDLGKVLQQKKAKKMAFYKYGETQFKMAQILGLACEKEGKGKAMAVLTNVGYFYLMNINKRRELLTRLMLKSNITQHLIFESCNKTYKVSDCMNMLSAKTINRRLPNVKRLMNELGKSDEFNFSSIINNMDFSYVEIKE